MLTHVLNNVWDCDFFRNVFFFNVFHIYPAGFLFKNTWKQLLLVVLLLLSALIFIAAFQLNTTWHLYAHKHN